MKIVQIESFANAGWTCRLPNWTAAPENFLMCTCETL